MSLGIIARWRVRPLRLGPSIPRVSLLLPARQRRAHPTAPFSCMCPKYSTSPASNPSSPRQEHAWHSSSKTQDDDGNVPGSARDPTPLHAPVPPTTSESLTLEDMDDYLEDELPPATYKDEYLSEEMRAMEDDLERGRFAGSVLVKQPQSGQQRVQAREILREHHKTITAQVRHARTTYAEKASPGDWRKVLVLLAQNTPMQMLHWIEEGLKVDVPREAMDILLAENGDYTVGAIRRRTGAVIKVSRDDPTLILSGTPRSINRATTELKEIAETVTITRLHSPTDFKKSKNKPQTDLSSFYEPPPSREEGFRPHLVSIYRHISTTPLPTTWTTATVEQFVAKLVDSTVAPHMHAPLYSPTPGKVLLDHERTTVERIERAFDTTTSMKVASRSALKLALNYMCEKGEKYVPEARSIFAVMDRRGLTADVDIYNIFLKAACKVRDLRRFQQTLGLMHRRGQTPNLDTWLLFLKIVQSSKVRSYVLQAMHSKNLLALPEALERVAGVMAAMDAEHAVTRKKDLATFLGEQQTRYGADWLSREAANQIIDIFATHGRFEDAFNVLNALTERYEQLPRTPEYILDRIAMRPSAASFLNILVHARNRGKMPVAVNLVRKMKRPSLHRLRYDKVIHILFEMAWKLRLRTTLVVLWRYASLARITSWRMRERVSLLLRENPNLVAKEMSESTYHELGGETLAQELAGGPAALARIRAITKQAWGGRFLPYSELGVLATKALPLAYGDFAPGVALGDILTQSVTLDFRCLRVRKSEQELQDLLQRAKVKMLPLLKKSPQTEGRVDMAPYYYTTKQVTAIGPQDKWEDQSASERWKVNQWTWPADQSLHQGLVSDAAHTSNNVSHPRVEESNTESTASTGGINPCEKTTSAAAPSKSPSTTIEGPKKQMVIINPRVWAAAKGVGETSTEQDHRTGVQTQEEEWIIAALDALEKEKMGFRQIRPKDAQSSVEAKDASTGPGDAVAKQW